MGKVRSKARWIRLSEGMVKGEDAEWLTSKGWLEQEGGGDEGEKEQVEAWVDADGGWTAQHVSSRTVWCLVVVVLTMTGLGLRGVRWSAVLCTSCSGA